MSQTVVSIVVPLFNRRDFVQETISSVVNQTYPHWELIIVDDGSTDGGYEFIERNYVDERIKLFRRVSSIKGANVCRNEGVERASGKYILFLDSDDLLASYCLERRVSKFQQHADLDFLVFPMFIFNEHPGDNSIVWNVNTPEDDLSRFLRLDAVWQTMNPIYRCDWLKQNKYTFDQHLKFWQDLDFHVRYLIEKPTYKKFLEEEPDCYCRRHQQASISQKRFAKSTIEINTVKRGVLDRFYALLKSSKMLSKRHRVNLAVSYLTIAESYFKSKYILKSYGLLIVMLFRRMLSIIDFFFIAIRFPLLILDIKFPGSGLLGGYENLLKHWITKEVNFPEYSILRIKRQ